MIFPYFKGQPTDYVIKYSGGRPRGEGMGLAFYYWGYNTQVVAVPTQSQEANFVFKELTSDFQEVTLQGQVTFRIKEPKAAAKLFNFSINPLTYHYLSEDREKIGRRIANLTQIATRGEVSRRTLQQTLQDTSVLGDAVSAALRQGNELSVMGVELLSADCPSDRHPKSQRPLRLSSGKVYFAKRTRRSMPVVLRWSMKSETSRKRSCHPRKHWRSSEKA